MSRRCRSTVEERSNSFRSNHMISKAMPSELNGHLVFRLCRFPQHCFLSSTRQTIPFTPILHTQNPVLAIAKIVRIDEFSLCSDPLVPIEAGILQESAEHFASSL